MKMYLRKIFEHDITHQISITKDVVKDFFDSDPSKKAEFSLIGKKTNTSGSVFILPATDPRFGGDIKTILNNEGGIEINDIILFQKQTPQKYIVEIINKKNASFSVLNNFFNKNERHLILITDKNENSVVKNSASNIIFPNNRIIFGAPGTGKSYKLNKDKDNLLNDGDTFERVTFHPDYSYANFVGCYKPIMKDAVFDSLTENQSEVLRILQDKSINAQDKYLEIKKIFTDGATRIPILIGLCSDDNFSATNTDDEECSASVNRNHGIALRNYVQLKSKTLNKNEISYEYIPGPFIRVLVNALKDKDHKHLLIIEEINRANVAAVFGDVFQLLDRSSSGGSEYGIQISEDLKKYLSDNGLGDIQELKIPNNMYIWATMNSADQGVFPMDTAFKRRWNFEYMSINEGEEKINTSTIRIANKDVNWNSLRKSINNYLSKKCINEDKLMGPFFLSSSEEITMDILKYKVLMYLHEDVVKHRNIGLFKSEFDMGVFSSICKNFEEYGIEIFNNEILETVEYSDMVSVNDEE